MSAIHVHTCNHFQGKQSAPCEKKEVADELFTTDSSCTLQNQCSHFEHSSIEQSNSEGMESHGQVSFLDARREPNKQTYIYVSR